MIQRRQFLGTTTAFATISLGGLSLLAQDQKRISSPDGASTNWPSRVIQTLPHGRAYRAPVVTSVCAQPGGNLLAIVGDDHYVSIFDLQDDRYLHHLNHHGDWVRAARFSANGRHLATVGNDRKLFVWAVPDFDSPGFVREQPAAIIHVAISHDSSSIATVGFDNRLRIYDLASGQLLRSTQTTCSDMRAVAYGKDDQLIAAGGRNGEVMVWNTDDGNQVADLRLHRQRVRSLEFMQDGRIVSCGDDQVVKITDLANPDDPIALPRHRAKLFDVQLIDDQTLATAGSDNLIRIWNLSPVTELGILKGHTGTVSCLDLAGNTLISGSYDTHVRLWDMRHKTALLPPLNSESSGGWTPKFK